MITTAAAIMVVVFMSFVLDTDPTIKMLGGRHGGRRCSSTPASCGWCWCRPSMSILGARAWWLPGWLDRVIPDLQLEGELEPVPETPNRRCRGATAGRASRP